MNKAVNAILGIGVAIVLFLFFILAFKIVLGEPEWEDCWRDYPMEPRVPYENLSEEDRIQIEQQERDTRNEIQECQDRNQANREVYTQKVFYAAIIIGIILIIAIIPLQMFANIAAGVGAAGLALFVYGLSVGWSSTSELVKLFLMFIAVVIVISLAVLLNLKKPKKRK